MEPREDRKFKISMILNSVFHSLYLITSLLIIFAEEELRKLTVILDLIGLTWYVLLLAYFIWSFISVMSTTKSDYIFEYNKHKCYFAFMGVILFISLFEFVYERIAFLYPNSKINIFSDLPSNVAEYIETFILLAPVTVYLLFKKVEDCFGCFNKCSITYSNHQYTIHDTIFNQENKQFKKEKFTKKSSKAEINGSESELSFDNRFSSANDDVRITEVLMEEYAGDRDAFEGRDAANSIFSSSASFA